MEKHVVGGKPCFWDKKKTEGMMEMDAIKASKGEKKIEAKQKRLMRGDGKCFSFPKTHLLSSSSLSFSCLPSG